MHTVAQAHAPQHGPVIKKMLLVMVTNGSPSQHSINLLLREIFRRRDEVRSVVLVPSQGRALQFMGLAYALKAACQATPALVEHTFTVAKAQPSHMAAKQELLRQQPHLGKRDVYVTFLN